MASPTAPKDTEPFRQSLRVVPVRNAAVVALPGGRPDAVRLRVTQRHGPLGTLWRRLAGGRAHREYVLDGVGREVYEDIDGRRNFEELIDRFAGRHQLSFLESRALLAQYYQLLTRRGLIVAALPAKRGP